MSNFAFQSPSHFKYLTDNFTGTETVLKLFQINAKDLP